MKNIYTYFLGIILSLIGSQAYAQLSPYDLNKPVGFGEKVTGGEGGRKAGSCVYADRDKRKIGKPRCFIRNKLASGDGGT